MLRLLSVFLTMGLLLSIQPTFAQDEDEDSPEKQYLKIAKNGAGVYLPQKDKKGRITSCIIVGEARISTALGKSKGMELARQKADLSCNAEFVKWLKTEVKVYQGNDEETVIIMDGKEENGENELKELGKSVEKSSTKMESISKGLVRGLQNVHKTVDGEGKNYILIKGFKADLANATKKLSKDLASDEPEEKNGKSASSDKSSKKKPSVEIESGSVTAPGAEDFLPKKKKK